MPLSEVLEYFTLWEVMLKIPVKENAGKHANPTWWVMMIRKDGPWPQKELLDFFNSIDKQNKRT